MASRAFKNRFNSAFRIHSASAFTFGVSPSSHCTSMRAAASSGANRSSVCRIKAPTSVGRSAGCGGRASSSRRRTVVSMRSTSSSMHAHSVDDACRVARALPQRAGRHLDDAERVLHLVHDHRRQLPERRQSLAERPLGHQRRVLQRQRQLRRRVLERVQYAIAVDAAARRGEREHAVEPAASDERHQQLHAHRAQRGALRRRLLAEIAHRLRARIADERGLEGAAERAAACRSRMAFVVDVPGERSPRRRTFPAATARTASRRARASAARAARAPPPPATARPPPTAARAKARAAPACGCRDRAACRRSAARPCAAGGTPPPPPASAPRRTTGRRGRSRSGSPPPPPRSRRRAPAPSPPRRPATRAGPRRGRRGCASRSRRR